MDRDKALFELKKCYADLEKLETPHLLESLTFEDDADIDLHVEAGYIHGQATRFMGSRSVESTLASIRDFDDVIEVDSTIGLRLSKASYKNAEEKETIEQFVQYDQKVKALARAVSKVAGFPHKSKDS